MPKKPQKQGLKVWHLANATTQYVHYFNIYYRTSHYTMDDKKMKIKDGGQGKKVVEKLIN
jgi:hypothetical protein